MIPESHPRYESLLIREKIVKAFKEGILADSGMIAHGRGEAFDYLLGEKTSTPAKMAIKAGAAAILLAKNPVFSVNGNTAALVAEEMVELSLLSGGCLEINLFHRTPQRVNAIEGVLKQAGAGKVLGLDDEKLKYLDGIESPRATASPGGIYDADVILVPLEDGDRADILEKTGKTVITIDLNPLSRTSRMSSISIVDNIVRVLPLLIQEIRNLKRERIDKLQQILDNFDNQENLKESLKFFKIKK
ncbi:MAG: phosphopantothenate/pantothenate synthetase [Euryarchaeota archaeon]|nr:phosphopantothenate/pantothenate synthetase [Euryarchaeota archaeon]MBU4607708.1 phosphopantothenate/pantothenate synthetase [Euryarchaeota archaeon]MBV1755934.1 phosphopantothenate/pantothenate synthetase [Methanobacterium sp.]